MLSVHLTRTDRPVLDQAYFIMRAVCHISGKQKEVGEKNWRQPQIKGMYMDRWCFKKTEHYTTVHYRIMIKWKGMIHLHNPCGLGISLKSTYALNFTIWNARKKKTTVPISLILSNWMKGFRVKKTPKVTKQHIIHQIHC